MLAVCQRDLLLLRRRAGDWIHPILFFVIVVTLFPLGVGPDPQTLASVASGVTWVAALLAVLLSLDSIFRSDAQDGSLEQFMVSHHPLALLVAGKMLAHWIAIGIPMLVVSPLIALMLGLPVTAIPTLILALLLGMPLLTLVGSMGVALTVGLPRGGLLLALLVLPLYVPPLIFATRAVELAAAGLSAGPSLTLLAAMLLFAVCAVPFATAAALRISLA